MCQVSLPSLLRRMYACTAGCSQRTPLPRSQFLLTVIMLWSVIPPCSIGNGFQAGPGSRKPQAVDKDIRKLEFGRSVERELAGGQSQFYTIALDSGQFLHAQVDQKGID